MKKAFYNFLLCLLHTVYVLILNGCLASFIVWYYDYGCMDYIGLILVTGGLLILEHFVMRYLKKYKLLNSTAARALLGYDYFVCGISATLWLGFSLCKAFTDHMMPDTRIIGTVVVSGCFMYLRTVFTNYLDKQQ